MIFQGPDLKRRTLTTCFPDPHIDYLSSSITQYEKIKPQKISCPCRRTKCHIDGISNVETPQAGEWQTNCPSCFFLVEEPHFHGGPG